MDSVNLCTKFEVCSFTHSWYNRGYSKFFWQFLDTPTLPFLQNFNGLLFGWTLWMYRPNLKSVALPAPVCHNSDWSFGWGFQTPNLGEEEALGSRGWYHSKERWCFPIALHSNFRLSLRVSQILPLLCSSTPPFSTPPLVSPKISHISLGVDGRSAVKSECVGLIVRAISFQDFQPMWSCDPDRPTLQMDGWHAITMPRFA